MVPFMSGMELSLKFVSVILGNERERERAHRRSRKGRSRLPNEQGALSRTPGSRPELKTDA